MTSSITTCPADKAAAKELTTSFPLTDASDTTGMTMTGDSNGAYVIANVGAHFDGDGDRVLLDVGTDYATSASGQGFAISYWFTKSVCNNEQDRYETLYQHTSSPDDPSDFFNETGTTSGITMVIGCSNQFSRSTAGGDIMSIRIKDDQGVNPQFDWQLGCAGEGDFLTDTWIQCVRPLLHPWLTYRV